MSALDAALIYIRRGWAPIPIPFRRKKPAIPRWPALRVTEADAPRWFNGEAQNVGVILGTASGDLVDVDLDYPEAVALGDAFLPETKSEFGRAGKLRSHRLYRAGVPKVTKFEDPCGTVDAAGNDKALVIVELRSNGGQTIFPPSTHAESGEVIEWHVDGEPTEVDPEQLTAAVKLVAVAALLARCAPADNRHDFMIDICGPLMRALGRDGAAAILTPVARLIFGSLYTKRGEKRLLDDTERRLAADEPVAGWPKLVERIGRKRTDRLVTWLGLPSAEHGAEVLAEIAAAKKARAESKPQAQAGPTPPPPEPPTQEEVDAIVADVGGLLGDLVQWMTSTARYPQPLLSLGAALAMVGALMGHRYRLLDGPDTRSNLMVLGLADSGSGKEYPRTCVTRALTAAGLDDWYMGRSIASAPGIIGNLASFHSGVMLLDEAGNFFDSVMNIKSPPYLRQIASLLMELSTSATSVFIDAARADDREQNAIRYNIPHPSLSMFATTTPTTFWDALNTGSADSGFLARFLLFATPLNYPDPQFETPPSEDGIAKLTGRMRQLVAGPGVRVTDLSIACCINALRPRWEGEGAARRRLINTPEVCVVPMTPEARAEDRRIALAEVQAKRKHEGRSRATSIIARTCEQVRRLALIRAASRNPFLPEIDRSDMLWGERVVLMSQRVMIPSIERYVSDTLWEAQLLKLLAIIRRHGDWIDTSTLGDRCYFMKPKDRRDAIAQLIEGGRLEWREELTATKPKYWYRVRDGG